MNAKYTQITAHNFTDHIYILGKININEYIAWDLYKRWRNRAPFCYHANFRPIVQRAATRTGFSIYLIGNACGDPSRRYQRGDKLEVTACAKQSVHRGKWQIQDLYWDLSGTDYIFNNACDMRVPPDNQEDVF